MINFRDCLDKQNIDIKKVSYVDNYVIVSSDNNNYLLKMKDSNKKEIFNYLRQIRYDYFLPLENDYNDYYEIYPYYEDNFSDTYSKAKELIYALSLLHLKTTNYVTYNYDKFKGLYEDISENFDNIMKYYLDLQDYLETVEFLSPAQYLLLKNISKFYNLLRLSRTCLDKWFNLENRNIREVLLINNVSLKNFRVGERNYFIDYKDAKRGINIYDLVSFYRNEAVTIDFPSLYHFYNSKYQLTQDEENLFYALIGIINKITFTKDNYYDTLVVSKTINYVNLTITFISEENKENEETNKHKFKE